MIREGDILFCLKDIEDIYYNGLLFKKNKSYKVCYSTSNYIILEHKFGIYGYFESSFIIENFVSLKEYRKIKLNKLYETR